MISASAAFITSFFLSGPFCLANDQSRDGSLLFAVANILWRIDSSVGIWTEVQFCCTGDCPSVQVAKQSSTLLAPHPKDVSANLEENSVDSEHQGEKKRSCFKPNVQCAAIHA